jgi:hypothetical protein
MRLDHGEEDLKLPALLLKWTSDIEKALWTGVFLEELDIGRRKDVGELRKF